MSSSNDTVGHGRQVGLANLLRQLGQAQQKEAFREGKFDPKYQDVEKNPALPTSFGQLPDSNDELEPHSKVSIEEAKFTLNGSTKPSEEMASREPLKRVEMAQELLKPVEDSSSSADHSDETESEDEFDLTFRPTYYTPFDDFDVDLRQTVWANFYESPTYADKKFDIVDASELEKKMIRQLEYYFGDFNLPKDSFMQDLMEQENGWISLATMLTFPRLAALCKDPFAIMTAIEKSPNEIIQVDRDFEDVDSRIVGRIRRHPSKSLPKFNDARRIMLQERTLFVGGFPKENVTLDHLIEYFEGNFDQVVGVRMRNARRNEENEKDDSNPQFLGSIFVTFSSTEAAKNFLSNHGSNLKFGPKKLFANWQEDFFQQKTEYNDTFRLDSIDRTVYVGGFDNVDTKEEELVDFFTQFEGGVTAQRRVFRDCKADPWKFAGSVFVTFQDQYFAEKFLALPVVSYNGDKLIRMTQVDFYEERGRFLREILILKRTKNFQ